MAGTDRTFAALIALSAGAWCATTAAATMPRTLLINTPRVVPAEVPADAEAFAREVQARTAEIAAESTALIGDFEVLPSDRPHCGGRQCEPPSLGALVLHRDGGCAALLVLGGADEGPRTLRPWVGDVRVADGFVTFGEAPERAVAVNDYTPCAGAAEELAAAQPALVFAVADWLTAEGSRTPDRSEPGRAMPR